MLIVTNVSLTSFTISIINSSCNFSQMLQTHILHQLKAGFCIKKALM